ncbi:hypothetical protein BSKO_09615 [Bryopsis sp. KO-2023]|nr:hypothetical protein BSKO_09615 [Bryopsis sp. KO-2023]
MAQHQTGAGSEKDAAPPSVTVTKEKVSQDFSHLYFKILNEQPELLAQFYGEDSSVVACESHNEGPTFTVRAENKEDIKKHLEIFEKITVELTTCAPQFSMEDSILLVVTGTLAKEGVNEVQDRLFTQAFLLAKQNEGFYIRTDTMQIHSNRCSTNILTNRPDDAPNKKSQPKQSSTPVKSEVSSNLPDPSMTDPPEALVKDQMHHKHESEAIINPRPVQPAPKPNPIELPVRTFEPGFAKSSNVGKKHAAGDFAEGEIQEPVFGSMSAGEIDPLLKTGGAMAVHDGSKPGRPPFVQHFKDPPERRNMGPGQMPRKPPMVNQKDQAVEPPSRYVKPIEKPHQTLPQRAAPPQYVEPNIDMAQNRASPYRRKSYVDVLRNPGGQIENRVTPPPNPLASAPISAALDVQTPTLAVQNKLGPSRGARSSTETALANQPKDQRDLNLVNARNRESDQQRKSNGNLGVGPASEIELRSKLTSLFVCRLPPDITAKSIEEIFSRFGELRTGVRVLTGPKSRYTFVNFVSEDSVRRALAAEIRIGSEAIVVERWQPKRDFRRNDFVRE